MRKCIIIAPLYGGEEQSWLKKEEGDLVLCADGGYEAAVRYGIEPDLVIGDFDSMADADAAPACDVIRLPVHKDDTDMLVCIRKGRARGYRRFLMAGCIGGRLCHTIANLQCLYDCALRGEEAWMCDGQNRVTVLTPGEHVIPRMEGRHLSLLAYTPEVKNVTLRGTVWELEGAALDNRYPIGVSNEFAADAATLSFGEGAVILVLAGDAVGA